MTQSHHIRLFFITSLLFFSLTITACGQLTSLGSAAFLSGDDGSENNDNFGNDPTTSPDNFKLAVCSPLTFSKVSWPKSMDDFDRNLYAIALTLTGSFEGHSGWRNIANNFDGQGISLGLFNQNLGQGTLQPLMTRMRDKNPASFKSFFNTANYNSVNNMLNQWKSAEGFTSKAISQEDNAYQSDFSVLDNPEVIEAEEGFPEPQFAMKASSIQTTINWAVSTLYSGSTFKADWKKSLQNMAQSPQYISEQLTAAEAIHQKAAGYMSLGFKEMRSYLFFFDIVVQNGGLSATVQNDYKTWFKSNSKATETAKLTKLLEYRLTSVIAKYRNDVKSRKMSIINGKGTVHGAVRDFPKEFCVKNWNISYSANGF